MNKEKEIVAYQILADDDPYKLRDDVMVAINNGYQPYGSPFSVGGAYSQAVVKCRGRNEN